MNQDLFQTQRDREEPSQQKRSGINENKFMTGNPTRRSTRERKKPEKLRISLLLDDDDEIGILTNHCHQSS